MDQFTFFSKKYIFIHSNIKKKTKNISKREVLIERNTVLTLWQSQLQAAVEKPCSSVLVTSLSHTRRTPQGQTYESVWLELNLCWMICQRAIGCVGITFVLDKIV